MTDSSIHHGADQVAAAPVPTAASRLAVSQQDRLAAFRLRYDVYIAEQGKPYPEADHDDRYLSDELDADGAIIVVESNTKIVGTVRANALGCATTRARYGHVFELTRFSQMPIDEMVVCSRLATSAEHRDASARPLLFDAIYEHGLLNAWRFCFVTCAPLLVRLFRRYGFREYAPPIKDPVVGTLHRNLLVLDDLEHLQRVQSPFVDIAARNHVSHQPRPWLTHVFNEYKARYSHA